MATNQYPTGSRPISATILAQKAPHELLIVLGGVLAIVLSSINFAISYMQGLSLSVLNPIVTTFALTLVLGGALSIAGVITRKNVTNGAIVAVVVSVILIVYGKEAGTIGGFIGIIGAAIAAVSPYLPRRK